MFSLPLFVALMQPAHADSEIRFRTAGPVVVLVDGHRATLSSTLDVRARNLEPGSHHVEVQSVLRKTIYQGQVEVADWTVTHASFANGRLEVLRTEDMRNAPEPSDDALVAAALSVDEPALMDDAGSLDATDAARVVPEVPPQVDDAPEVPAEPERVEDMPPDEGPQQAPWIAPVVTKPEASRGAAVIDRVSVSARPGLTVTVGYGEAELYVTVVDGDLVLTDQHGLQLRLSQKP
jgi:hypothetical protein